MVSAYTNYGYRCRAHSGTPIMDEVVDRLQCCSEYKLAGPIWGHFELVAESQWL